MASSALAQTTIDVDGDPSDWEDVEFTFLDYDNDPPQYWLDVQQIWVADDNVADDDGNLYLGIEFAGDFRPNVGRHDIDVYIYLDVDGDGAIGGPNDIIIEATEGEVTDGDGNPIGTVGEMEFDGSFLEVSIPYSELGLVAGEDSFGIAVGTEGHNWTPDRSPNAGEGDGGFISYDGSNPQPLAVTLADLRAVASPRGVTVHWSTGSERNNLGFHLWRLGAWQQWSRLTEVPVAGLGDSPLGRDYRLSDSEGRRGDWYVLEDLDALAGSSFHGPVQATWREGPVPGVREISKRVRSQTRKRRLPGSRAVRAVRNVRGPSSLAVKLAVREDGLNHLSWDALAEAGVDVGPRRIRLQRSTGPVPELADAAGIWFVGAPERDRYADFEVVTAGAGRGLRMSERVVWGQCSDPKRVVGAEAEASEQRIYYIKSPTSDPFYWAQTIPGMPAQLEFALPSPTDDAAELSLYLTGLTDTHAVTLELNGTPLGEVSWAGRGLEEITVAVPAGLLLAEGNQLAVEALAGAEFDLLTVDRLRVRYTRKLTATDGPLTFVAMPGECLAVSGVSDSQARLFDVSEPEAPVLLRGATIMSDGGDGAELRFADIDWLERDGLSAEPRRYQLVWSGAAVPTPQSLGKMSRPRLAARHRTADYLVVTHPQFASAAERIAEHHAESGLETLVVNTDEVYDEFSFGRPGPQAIRDLVATASSRWRAAPRFLLLVGGSTVDSNGHLATSAPDFVPTPFWVTSATGYEAASDQWYVAGDDGRPEWAVGRLAVGSANEAEAVTDKLLAAAELLAAPTGRLVFLADSYQSYGTTTRQFEFATNRLVAACAPEELDSQVLFKSQSSDAAADLLQSARSGIDALNYFGHGYLSGWSSGPVVLSSASASQYDNERPFLLFSWTCFDGAWVGPWGDSLAWSLVGNPDGGALLATAGSTTADPAALERLAQQLLCRLTSGQAQTVGEALRDALNALPAPDAETADLIRTYNLLGDPATPNPWRGGGE